MRTEEKLRATEEKSRELEHATLIKTKGGYNFWKLTDSSGGGCYWNITPVGQDAPKGGYRSRSYIEHIKHMQF